MPVQRKVTKRKHVSLSPRFDARKIGKAAQMAMTTKKAPPVVTVRRSADTGKFVTPQQVQRNPKTTVVEHYPKHKSRGR